MRAPFRPIVQICFCFLKYPRPMRTYVKNIHDGTSEHEVPAFNRCSRKLRRAFSHGTSKLVPRVIESELFCILHIYVAE